MGILVKPLVMAIWAIYGHQGKQDTKGAGWLYVSVFPRWSPHNAASVVAALESPIVTLLKVTRSSAGALPSHRLQLVYWQSGAWLCWLLVVISVLEYWMSVHHSTQSLTLDDMIDQTQEV